MKIRPKIGLRGKLSVLIILLFVPLSGTLTYYTSGYLASAINQEFMDRGRDVAGFLEANMDDSRQAPPAALLQKDINALMTHYNDAVRVSVYMPDAHGEVVNVASSEPGIIGSAGDENDIAPIATGDTTFSAHGADDGEASDTSLPTSTEEMLSPLHDAGGKVIGSVGVYLDTAPRDSLIRSQQVRFALITNLGLLALLIALYFSLNRMIIHPIKSLTKATRRLRQPGAGETLPAGLERHDEIGNLARAFGKLGESLNSRDEEVGLLLDASAAVSSTLHVDNILQTLCEKIAGSRMVSYCRISLLEPGGDSLIVKAASPTREMDWEYGIGHSLDLSEARRHAEVIRTGKVTILRRDSGIDESEETPDAVREWEWALTADTKSALLLPLMCKDEIIGVVTLGEVRSWDRTPMSAGKIEFYQSLMSQAAVAIENARLYEKTEWQVRELSALHKISQDFTSTLNYQEVVGVVAHRVGSLLGAHCASVLLPDDSRRYLKIVASYNLSAEYVWSVNRKRRIPVGVGPIGKAFAGRKAILVEDVMTDGSYENWKHIASIQGYSSLAAMPLMAKDESIGVICIYFTEQHKLRKDELELLNTAANEAAIAIENARMYEDLQDAFVGTIRSLAETIDAKDTYTRGHSERVSLYAEAIARSLELDGEELQTIRYAGYLHDVGKIGIPDAILTKPGKLTLEEFQVIKNHPVLSERILKPAGFPFPVQPIVRHHHERFDGKGYPDGMSQEEIPLGARILFVADAYEAMTSDRPYRKALSTERALQELIKNKGTQFDSKVVEAFVRIIRAGEASEPQMRLRA